MSMNAFALLIAFFILCGIGRVVLGIPWHSGYANPNCCHGPNPYTSEDYDGYYGQNRYR